MPVQYDSKKIIPAPLVEITKNYQRSEDGSKIGALFNLTVTGKLIGYMGSPDSSGNFWTTSGYPPNETIAHDNRLTSIIKKQEALRELFSEDGRWFEIQPLDGTQPMKCLPRVLNLTFPQGVWVDTCDYTITLEADKLYIGNTVSDEDQFDITISQATENWQIELNEKGEGVDLPQSYRLTHTVSAVGKLTFDTNNNIAKPAWQQARAWCLPRLGIDNERKTASGVINLPSYYAGYNHVRSETADEMGGAYSVIESWILASGSALEDFTISTNSTAQDGLTSVSIQGTIEGLNTRDSNYQLTTNKYDNAVAKFNEVQSLLLNRAQLYSGVTLNIQAMSQQVGRNPVEGTITYGFDYNNRPSTLIAGARSEIITITDNYPADLFASIPVLGRAVGPVLQDLYTISEKSRALNIEVVMPLSTAPTLMGRMNDKPNVTAIIDAASGGLTFTQIFKSQDTETWGPNDGRYTRQIQYVYQ